MKTLAVKRNQTLADIAIITYGDIAGIFDLLALNEHPLNATDEQLLGPMDTLHPGQILQTTSQPLRPLMTSYLAPYDIATGFEAYGQGISFWTINQNFIVS